VLAALACGACASAPDPNTATNVELPSYAQFVNGAAPLPAADLLGCTPSSPPQGVHSALEATCGTLDCHGQPGRPFRLYGEYGLRASAGLSGPLTDQELYANFLSAVALQPEEMSRVVAGEDSPVDLLLIQKPRMTVFHKGGKQMLPGDYMDTCLVTWLADPSGYQGYHFNSACCDSAAIHL
jgi:hypothetical protein